MATLVLFLLLEACRSSPPAQILILITLDTTRADHLSVYGYGRPTSPNLEGLAKRGVLFEAAYAPVNVTTASHATLFTSLPPLQHGVRANLGDSLALRPELETLAKSLRQKGFQTAAFVGAAPCGRDTGLEQGFDTFDEPDYTKGAERKGTEVMDHALRYLETVNWNKPLFVWIHLFDPHGPYEPPEEDLHAVSSSGQEPETLPGSEGDVLRYDGEIHAVDRQVGRLLTVLEGKDALVSVLADHGETLNERGCGFYHGHHLYEEQVHIPWILSGPRIPIARSIKTPVRLIDVGPTLLSALKLPVPEQFAGRDLLPYLSAGEPPSPLPLFFEAGVCEPARCSSCFPKGIAGKKLAIRIGTIKYVRTPVQGDVAIEAFDLSQDPLEQRNVVETDLSAARDALSQLDAHFKMGPYSPGYPKETGALFDDRGDSVLPGVLERNRQAIGDEKQREGSSGQSGEAQPTLKETLERLEALGYVR